MSDHIDSSSKKNMNLEIQSLKNPDKNVNNNLVRIKRQSSNIQRVSSKTRQSVPRSTSYNSGGINTVNTQKSKSAITEQDLAFFQDVFRANKPLVREFIRGIKIDTKLSDNVQISDKNSPQRG